MSGARNGRLFAVLAGLGVLVVAAVTAVVVAIAVRDAPGHDPRITAYAHGTAVTVDPYQYCDLRLVGEDRLEMSNCRQNPVVDLEVPPGYPLQLSLPSEIVDAPWQGIVLYAPPGGQQVLAREIFRSDYEPGTRALTIESEPEPGLRMIGVEIQLPVPAIDEQGNETTVPHASWSIRTGSLDDEAAGRSDR
ncbi:MAG TPA: DUF2771 domain-containing protein [Nocardia sp.]|uniref:DUF2771 domain-containing protein n=1 Tax=Nocardia TaxID=1817 RepID=UPI0024548529|nr:MULTISPECIES: DUF2771 domain-containing protein [Nocardia]HLS76228.1 DUF2771 domain-containing protein [Nocardia sp.]